MKTLKKLFNIAAVFAAAVCIAEEVTLTRTVLMVDENNDLNASGVASVEDVATNAVRVQIAEQAAQSAKASAQTVTNLCGALAADIMANNAVIYRSGYVDAFEGLVVFTDSDELHICEYTNNGIANGVLSCTIGYVCTVDIGVMKPQVYAKDSLNDGDTREDFTQVADSGVSTPVIHNEQKTIGGITYNKWYSITVSISVVGTQNSYFYWIKLSGDTPGGNGATIDLPNGVTGGSTETVVWGDKELEFVGGILMRVSDVD